jgi:thiol-disulfide isomerase/thioredoxin
MFDRFLVLFFVSIFLSACFSCSPNLESTGDSSDNNNDNYSFVTWDTCSQKIGDHPCNFTLKDQDGNDVSLYDFYGDTIVIDFSAMWCGPCRAAAAEVQEVKDSYESEGFTYLTVLIETSGGEEPDEEDCKDWADTYGISEPVLAGNRDMIDSSSINGWDISGWPTFYFITDDMTLNTNLRGYSSSYIDMLIQDTMGL